MPTRWASVCPNSRQAGQRSTRVTERSTTYAYDADDRLRQESSGTVTVTYEYDGNGNRIRERDEPGNATSYSYDHENRLVQIRYPSGTTCNYTYTPNGERMSAGCSPMTYYGYDIPGSGSFEDVVAEYDSSGTRQARYTHGPDVDEPVGVLRGGAHYGYHTDALASVTRITDGAQGTARSYRYDAWGRIVSESGSLSNSYTFTGREKDPGGSPYYYRARMYDPDVGRFTAKDPAGMVDGPNLYGYVGGNPTVNTDPSGNWIYYFGRSWVRGPRHIGMPPYPWPPFCDWLTWGWCRSRNVYDYPTVQIHLAEIDATRVGGTQIALFAIAAALVGTAGAAATALFAVVKVPWWWYYLPNGNPDRSFDWWIPYDQWNLGYMALSPSFFSKTPRYWWYSFWPV